MSIFLTGAGGFLGSAVLESAMKNGHQIQGLYRPRSRLRTFGRPVGFTPIVGDLRQTGAWREALARANTVIHCAAAASGDLATQLNGTVLATEKLLEALPEGLCRFIHVSSFSVYDFASPGLFGRLEESSALEGKPLRRDAYTQTKLMQERLVRSHCRKMGIPLVVVRPGAIYRSPTDWDCGRAAKAGAFDFIFAPMSSMRLIHVEDCANAIIASLDANVEGELILNLTGDENITHWDLHRRARRSGIATGIPVPIPYALVRLLGAAARIASLAFFHGRARLPELLDLPRQQARWKPLRYSNTRAKTALGWRPQARK